MASWLARAEDFVKTLDKTARDNVAQQLQQQREYDDRHGWQDDDIDDDVDTDSDAEDKASDDAAAATDDDQEEEEEADGLEKQMGLECPEKSENALGAEAPAGMESHGGEDGDGASSPGSAPTSELQDGDGMDHDDVPIAETTETTAGEQAAGSPAPAQDVSEPEMREGADNNPAVAVEKWGRMATKAAARDDGVPRIGDDDDVGAVEAAATADGAGSEAATAEPEAIEQRDADDDASVVNAPHDDCAQEGGDFQSDGNDGANHKRRNSGGGQQESVPEGGAADAGEVDEEDDSSSSDAMSDGPEKDFNFDGMAYGGDIGGFMFDTSAASGAVDDDDDDDGADVDHRGRGNVGDGFRGLSEGIGSAAKTFLKSMPPLLEKKAGGGESDSAGEQEQYDEGSQPTDVQMRKELDDSRATIAGLRNEKRALQSAVSALESSLADADAKLDKSSRAAAKWKRQKAAFAAREKELQSDAEASQTSFSFLEQRVRALEGERVGLKKQVGELQQEIAESSRRQSETDGRRLMDLSEREASAERRVQEERAAHNVTRDAALARESELLANLATTSESLIQVSRESDAKTERIGALETQLEAAEREAAEAKESVTMEMAKLKVMATDAAQAGRDGSESGGEGSAGADGGFSDAALREEANASRRQMQEAQVLRETALAEVQRLRVELTTRDDDIAERERVRKDLETKLNNMTDLLYEKQSQIDSASHGDAAARRRMESDMRLLRDRLKDAEDELRRNKSSGARSVGMSDEEMVSIESGMGNAYGRLTRMKHAGPALKQSISVLDSTANTATLMMRRSPTVRVVFSVYFMFIHLMVYFLLHRLQHHVIHHHDNDVSIAHVAASAASTMTGHIGALNATSGGGVEYHDISQGPGHLSATGR